MGSGWKRFMNGVLAVVFTVGMMPSLAFAAETDTEDGGATSSTTVSEDASYVEGEVIVVFEEEYSANKVSTLMTADEVEGFSTLAASEEVIADNGYGVTVVVELEDGVSVQEAIDTISQDERVAFVQPNYIYTLVEDMSAEDVEAVEAALEEAAEEAAEEAEEAEAAAEEAAEAATSGIVEVLSTVVNDPYALISEDDSDSPNQWWLYAVDAFEAWDIAQCDNTVTVAVIDTGINFEQLDLIENIDTEHAYDMYADEPLTESPTDDDAAHGSHVAGIISAYANNGIQFAGVSYNATILPINVFYYYNSYYGYVADTETIIEAYEYLEDLIDEGELDDLKVINMSLGGEDDDTAFENAIISMTEKGVLTVCAAGNEGDDTVEYPAGFDSCVSVSAVDSDLEITSWSSYGDTVDISAPGLYIWSTYLGGEDATYCASGTSMASPIVAGVAALLFASNPDLTPDEAKEILYEGATDVGDEGYDEYYGWGVVNAYESLNSMRGANLYVESDTIYVTQSVSVTAELYTNQDDDIAIGCGWTWEVDKPAIATIDEDGVLTALSEGTVTVTATSDVDDAVDGQITITIKPIAIPDGIESSVSGDAVELTWEYTPAATGYQIWRAAGNSSDSNWELLETVSVDDVTISDGSCVYSDTDVEVAVPYYYYVVPQGTLYDEAVSGKTSNTVAAVYKSTATELAGSNRYATMAKVVNLFTVEALVEETTVDTVIVASGTSYADALTMSGLAGIQNAPIVLTASDELSEEAIEVIESINPSKVFIAGGTSAVSDDVVEQIKEITNNAAIKRVAGSNRYKTALEIYDTGKGDWGKTAFIASGTSFADALSISSYAYATNSPIFLVNSSSTTPISAGVLSRLKAGGFTRVVILGGTGAVSEEIEETLGKAGISCERWAGSTRYETSLVIAENAVSEGVLTASEVGIVTGKSPWDALSAGSLMGMQENVVLLMDDTKSGLANASEFLETYSVNVERLIFFGGTNALPETVRNTALEAAGLL